MSVLLTILGMWAAVLLAFAVWMLVATMRWQMRRDDTCACGVFGGLTDGQRVRGASGVLHSVGCCAPAREMIP